MKEFIINLLEDMINSGDCVKEFKLISYDDSCPDLFISCIISYIDSYDSDPNSQTRNRLKSINLNSSRFVEYYREDKLNKLGI